jgi:hypothetical protein
MLYLLFAAVDSLQCAKKPAKDFADCVVDYLLVAFFRFKKEINE